MDLFPFSLVPQIYTDILLRVLHHLVARMNYCISQQGVFNYFCETTTPVKVLIRSYNNDLSNFQDETPAQPISKPCFISNYHYSSILAPRKSLSHKFQNRHFLFSDINNLAVPPKLNTILNKSTAPPTARKTPQNSHYTTCI